MRTCFLFPGQGSQYSGMGKDLWERSAKVRALFEHASDTTHVDTERLLFHGTEEELRSTDMTQIAVTLINLCVAEVLHERDIQSDGAAGFSLGEFSAMTHAGILTVDEVFHLVQARGKIMKRVASSHDNGSGGPGMAAVIGMTFDQVSETIQSHGIENLYAANYNAPEQIVLAGTFEALRKAEDVFRVSPAKRFVKLRVSAPFHSPLMEEARREIAEVVHDYSFHDPVMPVYSNVTAHRITTGEEAKRLCVEQIVSTIRWVEVERLLVREGYVHCIECGPGKVLSGLWRAVSEEIPCSNTGTMEQIEKL